MNIQLADEEDKTRWNEFVSQFSDYPCLMYEWRNVLKEVYGYECYYLIAEEKHEIVGVFPIVLIKSKLFGTRLCSLPFSDYGGPVLEPNKGDLFIVKEFLENLPVAMTQIDYMEVRSPIQDEVIKTLESALELGNMKYLTFIIDLRMSFDEIWRKRFNKYLRNAVRKAVKNKIEVVEENFEESLTDFYRLYLSTMKKLGSPPHGIEFFRACQKSLGKKVKIFLAATPNKIVGGVLVFLGRKIIYPAYEGIDPNYRRLNAASLLFSRIIEWGCENGYHAFDFGRTLYGSGVYSFKKRWGGKEKPLPYYYMGKQIPKQDPREKYANISKIWSKLPIPIAERIGPHIKGAIGH
jgi:FemAB-related protein (PEP-CTERM system-associated)